MTFWILNFGIALVGITLLVAIPNFSTGLKLDPLFSSESGWTQELESEPKSSSPDIQRAVAQVPIPDPVEPSWVLSGFPIASQRTNGLERETNPLAGLANLVVMLLPGTAVLSGATVRGVMNIAKKSRLSG